MSVDKENIEKMYKRFIELHTILKSEKSKKKKLKTWHEYFELSKKLKRYEMKTKNKLLGALLDTIVSIREKRERGKNTK